MVKEAHRFDFDEAMLPDDSWEGDLETDELEVGKIVDMGADRKTRYGRVHQQLLVHWKGYVEPSGVEKIDLNCGVLLQDFGRDRASRNHFEMMHLRDEPRDM